jgi:23S rRNA (guanosine2251-2'-O)-methyltransferase
MTEAQSYADKKAFYRRVLTVYGRKSVLEALADEKLQCQTLHLASSNRGGGIVAQLQAAAEQRGIPVKHHSRAELARISRNGKQDQGVALDVLCPEFKTVENHLDQLSDQKQQRLLALDSIHNPQNLGMIIRSATAGGIDGILWSRRGSAPLGPLVIKASAGTLYRAPLLVCDDLCQALGAYRQAGVSICSLRADAGQSLFDYQPTGNCIYILGNETEGVSKQVSELADTGLAIPMANGVESLNVAVTAGLIAYASRLNYLVR